MRRGKADRERRPAQPAAGPGLGTQLTRWLIGLRLLAVTALLIGVLLVQTTTDELLPIGSLARITGATYLLSLLWLVMELRRVPAPICGVAQLAGDLLLISAIVYVTGGLWSPFPFLYLITVGLAALIFGLRGALLAAGGAFVLYGSMVVAMLYKVLSPPLPQLYRSLPSTSSLTFQLLVTGAGFAVVALLTSYLAHSVQQAEAGLAQERVAKERLLALSADIVRSVDSGVIATDSRGTVILANPAAHRITADPAGLEGRPIHETLPVEGVDWDEILRGVERMAPMPRRMEGSLAGHNRPLGLSVSPLIGGDGSPVGLVVHFRDLTEAREAERQEHLRQRMAAVGEMAAGIAHEIRNPLASISGAAQVLSRLPALRESERRLMGIVVEESRRLSGIIESFLGYARPPAAQRGPCDVARTLEEVLALFSHSSEISERHEVETRITPSPRPVLADEGQLRQAFFNLARNAVQAMPTGGRMTVEAAPEGDRYVVRWHDEGIGMDAAQIREVFQPFRAFRTGGTGLGLAVVYSIVSEHGGDIRVDSEPGKGTTFTLAFPMEAA